MNDKIKIVWLCTPIELLGGTVNHLLHWAKGIDADNYEITLIYFSKKEKEINEKFKSLPGIKLVCLKELNSARFLYLPAIIKLFNILKREKAHILHNIFIQSDILGGVAAFLSGVPVVVSSIEGCLIPERTKRWKKIAYKLLYRIVRPRINRFIAISKATADEIVLDYKVDPKKIEVIHNGIDLSSIKNVKNKTKENGEYLIGAASHLVPEKGIKYLVEAMPMILKDIPSAKLLIAGEGSEEGKLKRLADDLGLSSKVSFLGFVPDIGDFMNTLHLFIFPSLPGYDGMPWVILEALAFGVPLITTPVGGIPEVVRRDREGAYVEAGNAQQIARAVKYVYSNPEKALSMSKAGADRIKEFTREKEISALQDLYLSLLGDRV